MRLFLLILALIPMAGCFQTRTQENSFTQTRRTGVEGGQTVDVTETTRTVSDSESRSGVDIAAVVQAGIAVATKDLRGAIDALSSKPFVTRDDLGKFATVSDLAQVKPSSFTGNQAVDVAGLVAFVLFIWQKFGGTFRTMLMAAAAAPPVGKKE